MRVLIVEDNASMRTLLVTLLGSQGYTIVGQLENGNTLLDEIRRLKPSIVCLDYQLPGRDGLDLLKDINSNFPEIDVVFMTGSEDADIEKRAADSGASGFLRKPFGQKQILDELRQVCEVRQQADRADNPQPAAASPTASGTRRAAARPTAIIVDDNSSIRLLLKGVLAELGMNIVAQAGNGEEAVRAAQVHQPQVLFLDVNMPIMSGLDALPKIREVSPDTAVVMVTGDTSRELVQQVAGLGARGYIVKPVRPAYVENFLKKLLNR
jgi:DNA-binding NarL/FixJ family response regulator